MAFQELPSFSSGRLSDPISSRRQSCSRSVLVEGCLVCGGVGWNSFAEKATIAGEDDALSLIIYCIYWADQEGFRGLILIYLDLFLFILQKQVLEVAMNMIGTEEKGKRQKAKERRRREMEDCDS